MDVKRQPLVSFTIPVYNMERYVGVCLDSIISQPFDDYEIVLVDNNSTDGSDAICREYAARHKQIRYYQLTGEPVYGRAAIYAVEKARGKYIHYVDSDDVLPPDVYAEIESSLCSYQADIFIGSFSTFIEDNLISCVDRPHSPNCINGCDKDQILRYLAENMPFHMPFWRFIVTAGIMRMTLEANVKTPIGVYTDTAAAVYMLLTANSIRYLDIPIYLYRIRSSSMSKASGSKQVLECMRVIYDLAQIGERLPKTEQEQNFVRAYIEMYTYTLVTTLCTLNNEQLAESISETEAFMKQFHTMQNSTFVANEVSPFLNTLLGEGAEATIVKYHMRCLRLIERIARDVGGKQGEVYIAPTGTIGLYMKTAFESKGAKIAGFFDNDEQKNGVIADEVPIHLPAAITKISGKKPLTILIASRYANVREELKKQFIALGVNESDLITVVF